MNRVDRIIRYLDRDMDPEESRLFEKEIKQDPGLRKEVEDTRLVMRTIGDEIQARDEETFKLRLQEAMQGPETDKNSQGPGHWLKSGGWLAVAAAAILVILILVRQPEDAWKKFYHPREDPVLLALDPSTRNGELSYYSLLLSGKPEILYRETSAKIMDDSLRTEARIFHIIAAMELGRNDLGREENLPIGGNEEDVNIQVLRWYRALALLSTGRADEAILELRILSPRPGPYQSDADKLLLLLTK